MNYSATYRGWGNEEPIDGLPGEMGPVSLEEIRVACVDLKLDATLYDAAGWTRGWVRADGSWRLV